MNRKRATYRLPTGLRVEVSGCGGRDRCCCGGRTFVGQRGGLALIELLLACMILSFVLGTSAVALHAMFQVNHGLQEQLAHSVLVPRLSLQLRADAHASYAADIQAAAPPYLSGLTLQLPQGRQVSYDVSAARIVRVVRRAGQAIQHEVYPLRAAQVRWEIDDEQQLLRVQIERDVGELIGARDSVQVDLIEAALGLHPYQEED